MDLRTKPLVVIVEPFSGGSHSQLLSFLSEIVSNEAEVVRVELPAKKWHWRLRASSVWAACSIPAVTGRTATVFCSSMLNVSELVSLRPDMRAPGCRIVLYFHENQLAYPMQRATADGGAVQTVKLGEQSAGASSSGPVVSPASAAVEDDRDFQFGWAQVLSCLVADVIAFNSCYNMNSFLDGIPRLGKMIPDKTGRPDAGQLCSIVSSKAVVAYYPVPRLVTSQQAATAIPPPLNGRLRIAWPHRWEYDKCPELFFTCLSLLHEKGLDFEAVVLGESFAEVPPVFATAKEWLTAANKVCHWGYAPSKEGYATLLSTCDVVVSTACHEFFGVSTVEAVGLGCYPLLPADLAYPEVIWPNREEKEANEKAEDAIRDILSRGRTVFPPPASSSLSAGASGAFVRRGDLQFKPTDRDSPCPHLYNTPAQLTKALARLAQQPSLAREWKRQLLEALTGPEASWQQVDGAGHSAAASAGGDTQEPASKRQRHGGPGPAPSSATVIAAAASRYSSMEGVYRALLLHTTGAGQGSGSA